MKHPLYILPDEELDELLGKSETPDWAVDMFRKARAVDLGDAERQEVLAVWHSTVPQPDGFRWPWPTLDRGIGMLPMGDLAVVLAQTGSGKTTFTASLLNRRKGTTLVFATEIPDDRYLSSLAARRAGLHPDRVQQGLWSQAGWRMTEEEARQKHRHAVYELAHSDLTIAPHLRLRASQLRDTLMREADRAQPSLVVVDHFQAIVHDLGDGVSATMATLELLQDFALTEYVTVVVTNQVHVRGQGGAPPKPTDCVHLAGVFGGQALGQAASQILGVHRVFANQHPTTGIALTPEYLRDYAKNGGRDSALWDRNAVAIDLLKIRYDAHSNVGAEVRLVYRDGQYFDPED